MLGANSSKPSIRTFFTDALAGGLTAAIFYAEYIGLGALLGSALPGRTSAALGGLMAVGAVVVSSLLALVVRQPFIAGPRAASLAVLIVGMKFATEQAQAVEGRFVVAMAALATMLVVGAATLLLGLIPTVQRFIGDSHVALRKGFIFATAVGIVVGLSAYQLDGCLLISPLLTVAIAGLSVGAALAWAHVCRSSQSRQAWLVKLAPLSMILGVGLATLGYYVFIAQSARDGLCGTLGTVGLQFSQFRELIVGPSTFVSALGYLPWWLWPVVLLLGASQGGVLLLESLTALRDNEEPTGRASWASQLKLRALVNMLCAPLGLASSSLSSSRTTALLEAHGQTRLAVFFHGMGLLVILFFCSAWIAKLPNLAVAVALILVAAQMIDGEIRNVVWRSGYELTASTANVGITWLFWCVIGFSMLAGSVLRHFGVGFGGGPLITLVLGAAAMALFTKRTSAS